MTWIDFALLSLSGACFSACIALCFVVIVKWLRNRQRLDSDQNLSSRGFIQSCLGAALGTLSVLFVQAVLFRQIRQTDAMVADTSSPAGWQAWAILATFLAAVVILLALACWCGLLLMRHLPESTVFGSEVRSGFKKRFLVFYGLAGVFGMIAVAIGGTIVMAQARTTREDTSAAVLFMSPSVEPS
ncbi:MAG: hypothetical protein D6695_12315 [Planctomycetota bacterium]|nr:MAG: hypothetical protein D6695_12315 [Planctomycetota bacterium]